MSTQFIRIEAYARNQVARVLGEAVRESEYCRHVQFPRPPVWWAGSCPEILGRIEKHMATPTPIKYQDGKQGLRKRRSDHRCLVAGVISWPVAMNYLTDTRDPVAARRLHDWILACIQWLRRRFRGNLAAVVSHADEAFPHLHFFCVGDANQIHPGLNAEFEDGARLTGHSAKRTRHKAGLRAFLDEYHHQVGEHFQLRRLSDRLPARRIRDRAMASRVLKLEQRLREIDDQQGLAELKAICDEAAKWRKERLRY